MGSSTFANPDQFGRDLRDRRHQLGLSVRAVATRAGVSPAYITAIETARNPSTGRPPVPSVQIVARLAAALDLDVHRLVAALDTRPLTPAAPEHVLLYFLAASPTGALSTLEHLFGSGVDHWLYIADPRTKERDLRNPRATICQWSLGSFPYETRHLDTEELLEALDREVAQLATTHAGSRVGLAITDCSAVMRYVQNASTEVDLEHTWHEHVRRIWRAHLKTELAIDVCAYNHDDVAALGLTIDQLATALDLITSHDRVIALAGDDITTGAAAARRILQQARPAGISLGAWTKLAEAAAESLAGTPGRRQDAALPR